MRTVLIRPLWVLCLAALPLAPAPLQAQVGEEVPFITTPDNVTLAMLQLAGVQRNDRVIDLGSGDGRIVITAAKRFGARGLGVEIVPDLVARSRVSARQAGVEQLTEFREQDLFKTDLSPATVITMYLLPEVNLQLRPALLQLAPGTRIVSHDWDMGDWLPDQTLTVAAPSKTIGREKVSLVHRWVVPARAEGLWCGSQGLQLRIKQRYQALQVQWRQGSDEWALQGTLDGSRMLLVVPHSDAAAGGQPSASGSAAKPGLLLGRVEAAQIVLQEDTGPGGTAQPGKRQPLTLQRASGAACSG